MAGIKKKIKKKFRKFAVVFTVIFLIIMYTPVANILAGTLTVTPQVKKADLVVVLTGGAYSNGVLSSSSSRRFIKGLTLYREGFSSKILFTGGGISGLTKKIIHTATKSDDKTQITIQEGGIMYSTALTFGMPESEVFVDRLSTNTYENVVNTAAFMKERKLKTCLLVSSPTHMYRIMRVVRKVGVDCTPAPVGDYTGDVRGATGRLSLMRSVVWEYAALALYRINGYI